jgi:cellulose synthase/poly-beta-1,6-N-acetylglucosamine synthase-like glycosyltransferase
MTEGITSLPYVSVVVPALNCAGDVIGFADSMRAQDYPADRFEVIVVDNGSADGTYELAREAGLTSLQRAQRGRTKALNAGIAAAKGELILTTDMSCRAEPWWIRTVVDTFAAHPHAGCVAGEIKLLRTTSGVAIDFQERSAYMSPLHAARRTRLPFMPFADGANASFRKKLFDEIGGFEESFVKAGDVEICYRMFVLSDYSLIFNPRALVWEPGEPSLRALLHQRFRMGIGWNLLTMKYPDLFASASEPLTLRRAWWMVREELSDIKNLVLKFALAVTDGQSRAGAVDASVQILMGWVQSYGRIYGKLWLTHNRICPPAINGKRFHEFAKRSDPLSGRVILIGSSF